MGNPLHRWRKRTGLTQVEAATVLGVSQPYLSLLEKGTRPLTATVRARMKAQRLSHQAEPRDDRFRAQLSSLGYPGFAHIRPARPKTAPDQLLLSVLSAGDADARVVEALPWLVRRFAPKMDFRWLVRQAKLGNLQNRLGFVLDVAGSEEAAVSSAVHDLDHARLMEEATLCWESMPTATRTWMRENRTSLAAHWNVLTRMRPDDFPDTRGA
jgi:transcriptional regulator with XRE-family HTH domain